jgi:hypothetical protein
MKRPLKLQGTQSYEIQYIKLCEPLCHCASYITHYSFNNFVKAFLAKAERAQRESHKGKIIYYFSTLRAQRFAIASYTLSPLRLC